MWDRILWKVRFRPESDITGWDVWGRMDEANERIVAITAGRIGRIIGVMKKLLSSAAAVPFALP